MKLVAQCKSNSTNQYCYFTLQNEMISEPLGPQDNKKWTKLHKTDRPSIGVARGDLAPPQRELKKNAQPF